MVIAEYQHDFCCNCVNLISVCTFVWSLVRYLDCCKWFRVLNVGVIAGNCIVVLFYPGCSAVM